MAVTLVGFDKSVFTDNPLAHVNDRAKPQLFAGIHNIKEYWLPPANLDEEVE